MLTSKVKQTLEKYGMLEGGHTVIAAVSGGADSVALLFCLYSLKDELGFKLCACHVNHNLRGEESDRDEMFVRRLCRLCDIPLYVRSVRVLDYRKKHESLEECARTARYVFFEQIGKKALIATAHTASDNCETVLINILRGTALSGICGIPPVRDNIIRPLISCTREEIELYCKENSLDYVTDSTNFSEDYTRNKLRHNVIPMLEKINPSFCSAVSRLSESAALDDRYLDGCAIKLINSAITEDGKYKVEVLQKADECILRRAVTTIFNYGGIPVSNRAINSCVQIIRQGRGKINPSQFKFVQIRKKLLYVVTDYEKFRRN